MNTSLYSQKYLPGRGTSSHLFTVMCVLISLIHHLLVHFKNGTENFNEKAAICILYLLTRPYVKQSGSNKPGEFKVYVLDKWSMISQTDTQTSKCFELFHCFTCRPLTFTYKWQVKLDARIMLNPWLQQSVLEGLASLLPSRFWGGHDSPQDSQAINDYVGIKGFT